MPYRTCLIALALAALLVARESSAQWQPGGLPIAPGPGAQFLSGVVSDGASGAFVAWLDAASGHSRLLRIDGTGYASAGWPAEGIDVAGVAVQVLPDLVSDGAGGVILFATAPGGAFAGVRAFRFDPSGAVPSPWPATGREATGPIPGTSVSIRAVPDALGGAFLFWTAYGTNCPGHDCYSWASLTATRVMADGTLSPYWPRGLASNSSTNNAPYGLSADATPDGSGGVVGLVRYDWGPHSEVVRFDSSGEGLVRRYFSSQPRVDGCLLPGGDFLVATGDALSAGPQMDVHLYRLAPLLADAPGWPAAGVTLGESGVADLLIQVIPDGGSGAFVVWTAGAATPNTVFRVQHVTGGPPPATSLWPAPGTQIPIWNNHAFATDGIGGFVSVGYDEVTQTLRALHLDASGQPAPGMSPSGVSLGSPASTLFKPPAANQAGAGGVIVAWSEARAGDWNVYAQRLPFAIAVGTVVAGVSAEHIADGIRVTWWLEDGLASALLVERSVENGDWQSLGPVSEVSFDQAVYEDHSVSGGMRYAYRLRASDAESPLVGSEVSVDYSPRLENVLVGFVPSPAVGSPRVRFRLAGHGMKELQIIDIAGRVVARHDVSGLPAGPHELNAGRLAPGLYTLRLTGPSGTRVTRGVVLR